jgi:hypothetical protein
MSTPSPEEEELSSKNREPDEHMLGEYRGSAVLAAECIVTGQT